MAIIWGLNQAYMSDLASKIQSLKPYFSCVICQGSSMCSRCESRLLFSLCKQYEKHIAFLTAPNDTILDIEYDEELDIKQAFVQTTELQQYEYEEHPHYSFFTITFDPNKFGTNNDSAKERQYILNTILQFSKRYAVTSCYGSFELHANGSTHTHMIIGTNFKSELIKFMKPLYTDNPRNPTWVNTKNKKVIGPARKPTAKEYIDKKCEHTPIKYWYKLRWCASPINIQPWTSEELESIKKKESNKKSKNGKDNWVQTNGASNKSIGTLI